MAAINGTTGSVSVKAAGGAGTEIFLHIDLFSMDAPREDHEITTFDSTAGWEDKTVGLVKWTGTIEGFYQDASEAALSTAEINTDTARLVLTSSTGRTYTWTDNATIRDVSFATEVGVPNRWTAAFTGNGSPAIT